ncbi:zinc transporter foi, partial [Asbolus verrucosus]
VKMAAHVISVCVFCLICATHSPCGSHAAVAHENPQVRNLHSSGPSREKFKEKDFWDNSVLSIGDDDGEVRVINKRNSDNLNSDDDVDIVNNKDYFLKKIFTKFGDGKTITMDGFQDLLGHMLQLQLLTRQTSHGDASNETCAINNALMSMSLSNASEVNYTVVDTVCPAILYSMVSGSCPEKRPAEEKNLDLFVWLYSLCAVIVISACGVLSLFIIPVMQKKFYKPLLQFLVALAVGTLAGDALLHLLPHAMSSGHRHDHGHEENHENMWKGFVAMLGLILFFVMERFIPLVHRWRKGKPSKVTGDFRANLGFLKRRFQGHSHVKVLSSGLDINKAADTQCMDKYNAYPRCYKDIVDDPSK